MKKLTLNQAWTLCLRQWKWIIKQLGAGSEKSVGVLKMEWIRKNKYRGIKNLCFFCQYCIEQNGCPSFGWCEVCPGHLISTRFDCEKRSSYHWANKPRAFYRKLLELDKKRKAKK